jgi:hypothetical protein
MTEDGAEPTIMDNWGKQARDGVLLVTGVGMLIFETVITLFGYDPNQYILGAALAILIGAQAVKGGGPGA